MRIAVMGTGGVGGYFGGRLAAAGVDVTFIARGAHLEAMRERGLEVRSALGDIRLADVAATDDPATVGPVDVVLFATKLYGVEEAGAACRPLVGEDTVVVTLLNGVDSEECLARLLGEAHVAGGVAHISAAIAAPGVIQHNGTLATMRFGEMDRTRSARLEALEEAARAAGIDARLSEDIEADIWRKFVFLASFAAITTLTRLPIGPIRADARAWALLEEAVREVAEVAAAKGLDLGDDVVGGVMANVAKLPDDFKSSMLVDLERGNRLELEWLSGAVCRLGAELGAATPVHRVALAALGPYANGPPPSPGGATP